MDHGLHLLLLTPLRLPAESVRLTPWRRRPSAKEAENPQVVVPQIDRRAV